MPVCSRVRVFRQLRDNRRYVGGPDLFLGRGQVLVTLVATLLAA